MKNLLKNPTSLVFIFLLTVLVGSNICCTGKSKASEKTDETTAVSSTNEVKSNVSAIDENTFDEKIKSGITLVDFWAAWCMPCRRQAPILEEVGTEMTGKASVYKLDIDSYPNVADRYGVQSIPTMILFKDGKEVSRFVGVTSKDDIVNAMKKFEK